jgi:hypothetical protein
MTAQCDGPYAVNCRCAENSSINCTVSSNTIATGGYRIDLGVKWPQTNSINDPHVNGHGATPSPDFTRAAPLCRRIGPGTARSGTEQGEYCAGALPNPHRPWRGIMEETETSQPTLLDELAGLDPQTRRALAR